MSQSSEHYQNVPKELQVKEYLDKLEYSYIYNRASAEDKTVCGKYRPDFLFKLDSHYVVVEVDENEHYQYESSCEVIRMLNITYGLGLHVVFLRFNPDLNSQDRKNKVVYSKELFTERMEFLIEKLDAALSLTCSDLEKMALMTVEYLFYSKSRRKTLKEAELTHVKGYIFDKKDEFFTKSELCRIKESSNSNGFVCQFCSKVLSSKGNLKRHQSAISCIERQSVVNKTPVNKIPSFVCKYCSKSFTRKETLDRHEQNTCTGKEDITKLRAVNAALEMEINQYKEERTQMMFKLKEQEIVLKMKDELIDKLEKHLQEKERTHQILTITAMTNPTTTIRNTIKNSAIHALLPLKEEEMKDHAPFLTLDHIKEGPEGYVKFALSRPFKDRVVCTDVSRKKLAWKTDTGEIIYDTEGNILSEKFFRLMREQNEQLYKELLRDLEDKLSDDFKRSDQKEADAMVKLINKFQTWRTEAYNTSKGESTELAREFIRSLCNATSSKKKPRHTNISH